MNRLMLIFLSVLFFESSSYSQFRLPGTLQIRTIDVDVQWSSSFQADYRFVTRGFSRAQNDKLNDAMQMIYDLFTIPGSQSNIGDMTEFQKCVVDNTTRFEAPNWGQKNLSVRRYTTAIVSSLMVLGNGGGIIKAFTEDEPQDGREFIRAGFAPVLTISGESRIDISMNRSFIDDYDVVIVAGTLFHEMLHNAGWTHPTTGSLEDYPGTLIKEADICLEQELAGMSSFAPGRLVAPPYRRSFLAE